MGSARAAGAVIANHPLLPRHVRTQDLPSGGDLVAGRQLLFANDDVRISFAAAGAPSELYRNSTGDEAIYLQNGSALFESVYGSIRAGAGDYVALLAYIDRTPEHIEALQRIRRMVRDQKRVATCLGFGPRFLHSTGQAYKGGPNSGVFLQITCDEPDDLPVPQQKYTFGVVKAAQARGDFQVLAERQRRALRVHLGKDLSQDLDHLRDVLCAAVAP